MDTGMGWWEEGEGRMRGLKGASNGGDGGWAPRKEASKVMTRGTHLTAVYPALFICIWSRNPLHGLDLESEDTRRALVTSRQLYILFMICLGMPKGMGGAYEKWNNEAKKSQKK